MSIPVYYDHMNVHESAYAPSTIKNYDSYTYRYYARYLLQKAFSVFTWKLPENWNKNFFLYCLYCFGKVAIVRTDKYGVVPQPCTLYGYNVMYQPTNAIIANPLLKGIVRPRIGKECALIHLQPDYGGIMDIVDEYATKMALASAAIDMNILNSRLSYVFAAQDKGSAETFKALYDEISQGQVAVAVGRKLFDQQGKPMWQTFQQNLANNYIANDILETVRLLENQFATKIGIANANIAKKERLISDEVNANNEETDCLASMWLETLKEQIKVSTKLFGDEGKISVEWRFEKGGDNLAKTVDSRDVQLR